MANDESTFMHYTKKSSDKIAKLSNYDDTEYSGAVGHVLLHFEYRLLNDYYRKFHNICHSSDIL